MFVALMRILFMVICLGASSFASASVNHENNTMYQVAHDVVQLSPICNQGVLIKGGLAHQSNDCVVHGNKDLDLLVSSKNSPEHSTNSTTEHAIYVNNYKLIRYTPQSIKNKPSKNQHKKSELVDFHLTFNKSNRLFYTSNHNPEEISPDYELVFEIPIIPAPSLVIGYQEPLCPSVNWILKIKSVSSRISGWKETNLIYSRYSHQLLAA